MQAFKTDTHRHWVNDQIVSAKSMAIRYSPFASFSSMERKIIGSIRFSVSCFIVS